MSFINSLLNTLKFDFNIIDQLPSPLTLIQLILIGLHACLAVFTFGKNCLNDCTFSNKCIIGEADDVCDDTVH